MNESIFSHCYPTHPEVTPITEGRCDATPTLSALCLPVATEESRIPSWTGLTAVFP
ncbi:hypothetical protein [Leyella lascolaii]|uniref:hypothetical protein n=1 Tax=Leyella lascolaii TaxID=1776379 RepID=UPI0029434409|nr:hypothetical protein [Leyella lascolaii]